MPLSHECVQCGKGCGVTERVICPHCREEVEAGWLCSKCGQPLSTSSLLADDPIQGSTPTSTEPPPTVGEQHAFESPMDAIADEPESVVDEAQGEPQPSSVEEATLAETEAPEVAEAPEEQLESEEEEPVTEAAETVEP